MIKEQTNNSATRGAVSAAFTVSAILLGLVAPGLMQGCDRDFRDAGRTPETVYAEPRAPVRDPDSPGLPVPFDRQAVYRQTLQVHPAGDDAVGDGTRAAPFATVARALREAAPGTRVILAPGRHAPIGSIPDLHGEPGAPIAIVGAQGSIIDGRLTEDVVAGLHLSNPRHVVIEGLTVEHAYPHGVSIDDGGDYTTPAGPVILRGLVLRNIGRGKNNDCLKLSGVDDFQVLDSEFANCDEGEAIDMVGCHRGFISGNTFRRTPLTAVQTKGGSSDIIIHGNRFIEVTARSVNLGGHTGARYFRPFDAPYEAARIQVLSNIFYRSGDTAIAFTGCIECLVAHNTIIDPQGHVVRLLEEHPDRAVGRDGMFINNLVALKAADLKGFVTPGVNTRPDTFRLGWNLWYARDRNDFQGPQYPRRLPAEESPLYGIAPAFVDPSAGDYRLQDYSPAGAAGREDISSSLPDFHGLPFRVPPTIGAHSAP